MNIYKYFNCYFFEICLICNGTDEFIPPNKIQILYLFTFLLFFRFSLFFWVFHMKMLDTTTITHEAKENHHQTQKKIVFFNFNFKLS